MISGADNRKIGRKRPSEYRRLCVEDDAELRLTLDSALCPSNLFDDNYDDFLAHRAKILFDCAQEHIEEG